MLRLGVTRFGINAIASRRIIADLAGLPGGALVVEGVSDA